MRNAIRFQIEDQFESHRGKPILINSHIIIGIGIIAAARRFHHDVELFWPVLLGAVKHHVLKKMRDASRARTFVSRANPVKNISHRARNGMVLVHKYFQPVRQRLRTDIERLCHAVHCEHHRQQRYGKQLDSRSKNPRDSAQAHTVAIKMPAFSASGNGKGAALTLFWSK